MIKITAKRTNQFLALLLICGFVLSAFGHHAVASLSATSSDKEASQFLLPGETLASLCLNSPDDTNGNGDKRCDFCVLGHGMATAIEQHRFDVPFRRTLPEQLPVKQAVYQNRFQPCPPGQAPPFFS